MIKIPSAIVFVVALAFVLEVPSAAQNMPQVQVQVGIDGNYKMRTWTPVNLLIDPQTASMAPLDINLLVAKQQRNETQILRRYSTSLRSHQGMAPAELSVPVYLSNDSNYIIVQISKEGKQLSQQSVFLSRLERSWRLFILILTSRPEDFSIISSIKMEKDTETILSMPKALGDDCTFYSSISFVVADNIQLASLTDKQFDALRLYLYKGGNLLFTADGLELNASDPRLRALADLDVKVKRRIPSPAALDAFCKEREGLVEYVDALDVSVPDKDVLLRAEGFPLIIQQQRGLGCLWALTFSPKDVSLRDLSKSDTLARKIWKSILEHSETHDGELRWEETSSVAPKAELENVSGPIAVYILILAVVLGPLNYAVLKKLDKREYILLTIPAVTLLLGIGAFVAGLVLKGDQTIKVTRNLIFGKGGDTVFDHRQYVGVLSPRKRLLGLSSYDEGGRMPQVLDPIMMKGWGEADAVGRFPLAIEYADNHLKASNVEIPMWGMQFLQFLSTDVYEKAITYSLSFENGSLTGRVENGLPFALKQCFIVCRHNNVFLGDLGPNGSKEFKLKISPPPSLDEVRLTSYARQEARGDIFHKVFWQKTGLDDSQLKSLEQAFLSYQEHFEDPVLIGWTDAPSKLNTVIEDGEVTDVGSELMVFKLPLYMQGSQISVPIGLSRRRSIERSWCNPFALSVSDDTPINLEFQLPFRAHEKFDAEELTVHMLRPKSKDLMHKRETSEEPTLSISIFDWPKDEWTKLLTTNQAEVHQQITENPERYVRFPQGLIRLKVESVGGGRFATYFPSGTSFDSEYASLYLNSGFSRSWFLGIPLIYLDISLRGKFPERPAQQ